MTWTLVTGGAQNFGASLCKQLAKEGKSIALHYKSSSEAARALSEEIVQSGGSARAIYGDFSTQESTEDFLSRYKEGFGDAEMVVHNVGNYLMKSASNTSVLELRQLFETNLYAPFQITQALLPFLKKNRGQIIFIGIAGVGTIKAETYSTCYHLTKLCLYQLTKSLAKELAPQHVRVNMISPGYLENSMDHEEASKKLPFRRTATFDEAAKAVAFLCSKEAAYITGQNLEVAGGVRL